MGGTVGVKCTNYPIHGEKYEDVMHSFIINGQAIYKSKNGIYFYETQYKVLTTIKAQTELIKRIKDHFRDNYIILSDDQISAKLVMYKTYDPSRSPIFYRSVWAKDHDDASVGTCLTAYNINFAHLCLKQLKYEEYGKLSSEYEGRWENGHIIGEKYEYLLKKYLNGDFDFVYFRDQYNFVENYSPQCVPCNRSHIAEK